MNKNTSPFVTGLFLLGGIAMFSLFSWDLNEVYSIKKNGITSYAKIESYSEKRKNPQAIFGQKSKVYSPTYSFIASNGKKYTMNGKFHEKKKFTIGDKVKVIYLENNPVKSALEGDLSTQSSWLMILLSILIIGFPIYYHKRS